MTVSTEMRIGSERDASILISNVATVAQGRPQPSVEMSRASNRDSRVDLAAGAERPFPQAPRNFRRIMPYEAVSTLLEKPEAVSGNVEQANHRRAGKVD